MSGRGFVGGRGGWIVLHLIPRIVPVKKIWATATRAKVSELKLENMSHITEHCFADFCNNSSSIPHDPLKTPEKMKYVESRNDCQTCEHPNHTPQRQNFYDNSYEESSDNGIPYQQSYQNFSQSSSQYYSPRPTDFNHLESERQYVLVKSQLSVQRLF